MVRELAYVEGLGHVVQSDGDLTTNERELKGKLISPRNDAYARIHTALDENIGKSDGTRVSIEADYIKGEAGVLVRCARLSHDLAQKVVKANSQRKYFCTDSTERYKEKRKIAEREEKQGIAPAERRVIVLPSRDSFDMTLTRNRQCLDFLLEDLAQAYYQTNGNFPITFIPLDKNIVDGNQPEFLTNPNGTIVIPYLWFGSLGGGSGLDGGRDAGYHGRARGVFKKSAEGTSQKISKVEKNLPYTQRQVDSNIKRLGRLEVEIKHLLAFFKGLK